jgi:hypothetical protein
LNSTVPMTKEITAVCLSVFSCLEEQPTSPPNSARNRMQQIELRNISTTPNRLQIIDYDLFFHVSLFFRRVHGRLNDAFGKSAMKSPVSCS